MKVLCSVFFAGVGFYTILFTNISKFMPTITPPKAPKPLKDTSEYQIQNLTNNWHQNFSQLSKEKLAGKQVIYNYIVHSRVVSSSSPARKLDSRARLESSVQ